MAIRAPEELMNIGRQLLLSNKEPVCRVCIMQGANGESNREAVNLKQHRKLLDSD